MYDFLPLTPARLPDAARLFRCVAGRRVSVEQLKKKYRVGSEGEALHGFLAVEKSSGQAVALAAALRFDLEFDGKIWQAAQTCDTLTLPEHAGRGLMTELLRRVVERLEGRGIEVFFGFCNQNSHHVYVRKLGWSPLFEMQCFAIPVRTWPFEAVFRRLGLACLHRFLSSRCINFRETSDAPFANSLATEGWATVQHDASFFQHKSFTFNRLTQIGGTDVWLKPEHGLLVGDCSPPPDFDFFLEKLRQIACQLGTSKIVFQTSPGSRLGEELAERFQPIPSWTVVARCLTSDFPLERLCFGYGDVDTF